MCGCGPSEHDCRPSEHDCGDSEHDCGASENDRGASEHDGVVPQGMVVAPYMITASQNMTTLLVLAVCPSPPSPRTVGVRP